MRCPVCNLSMVLVMWDRPGGPPGNGWRCPVDHPSEMVRSVVVTPITMPEDVRAILTNLAQHAHENPTSAERRRIGDWLGLPRHLLPKSGT